MMKKALKKHANKMKGNKRYYINSTSCNNSTKLLQSSNGTNVKECEYIENIKNL